ncbi:MAG: PD-(D/E)XK nuclease family protein [Proteobacteria bacterium]|jgi:CRISPR/Cas system-associated exonuclease Cas4 (RecB family)|nr:PD-(D/E)XK nuclease family protein [Pseudomonadota bacterium]
MKIIQLSSPDDKKIILDQFDPREQSWVVADLRVKFEIQRSLLEKYDCFDDFSVTRVSELWRHLLKVSAPLEKEMSLDFLKAIVRQSLRAKSQELLKSPQAEAAVIEALQFFGPFFFQKEKEPLLADWLKENPQSVRWVGWYDLARELFQDLRQKKFLLRDWFPLFLNQQKFQEAFWKRPLIFDLGIQLTQAEADLIQKLEAHMPVTILQPAPSFRRDFEYLFSHYDQLQNSSRGAMTSPLKDRSAHKPHAKSFRFPSMLAESRWVVGRLRELIDQGISPSKIGVLAADIELYWPVLQPLCEAEGIPTNKDIVTRLTAFPEIERWLGHLRLAAKKVSYADLGQVIYPQVSEQISFEEFKGLFVQLLGEEDLSRLAEVEKIYQSSVFKTENLSAFDFIGLILKSSFRLLNEKAESVLKKLLEQSLDVKMSLSDWLFLLESLAHKAEVLVGAAQRGGVHFLNSYSADMLHLQHRIYLGVTESQVKAKNRRLLRPTEIFSLGSQTGILLADPELSPVEFDFRWSLLGEGSHELCFPEAHFSGAEETAVQFWLEIQLQESSQPQLVWDQSGAPVSESEYKPFPVALEHLSPSGIEDYLKCPFVFAARRVFRLGAEAVVDMELDPRSSGTLDHALLQELYERENCTERDIEALLEEIKTRLRIVFFDGNSWKLYKRQKFNLALRFLKFQKELKKALPEFSKLATEMEIRIDDQGIQWLGKIDRVDQNQHGHIMLYDYKSSTASLKSFPQWLPEGQIQLLFYVWLLKNQNKEVSGAFYFDLKRMKLTKGFYIDHEGMQSLSDLVSSRAKVSVDVLTEATGQLEEIVSHVLDEIKKGEFPPKPRDKNDCPECDWRHVCRAPHLN